MIEDLGDRRLAKERRLEGGRLEVGCECELKDCVNLIRCKGIYTQDMWPESNQDCPHYMTKERRANRPRRIN